MTKQRASEAFDLLKQGREKEARTILEKIVKDDMADFKAYVQVSITPRHWSRERKAAD